MAELVFIVSRTEPKQYLYLKHAFCGREQGCSSGPPHRRAAPELEAAADGKTPHRPAPP
jgi:hypothetical protein